MHADTSPSARGRLRGARTVAALVLFALCVAGLVAYLRLPPAAVRLLPEADAVVYLDLKPLRSLGGPGDARDAQAPGHGAWADATGIVVERDLERAAFALNRMPDPAGPNGPVAFSEILEGRFDRARLERYLGTAATARESYAGHTVYLLPSEGRTVRVAVLSGSRVAVSNAPTPEQMHGMLDRAESWWPRGNELVRAQYGEVPALAGAWAIGALGAPFATSTDPDAHITLGGLELPLRARAVCVASLRPVVGFGSTALRFELDMPAEDAEQARRMASAWSGLADMARTFATLAQTLPGNGGNAASPAPPASAPPASREMASAFQEVAQSVTVDPGDHRVMLTATIPRTVIDQFRSTH